jgi:hypothetical protein
VATSAPIERVSLVSRVNFLETEPDRIGDVARVVHEVVHPGIRGETGYVGYIVLGHRETGKALGITLWEGERAMEASDAKAREIRPRVEQETGGTMRAVERYEVLLFDVRVDQPFRISSSMAKTRRRRLGARGSPLSRQEMLIEGRFCGPPDSGNGGYVCGLVAGILGGAAEVTLRRPPPIGRPLVVRRDGGVAILDGDAVVAEGVSAEIDVEPPDPIGLEDAVEAAEGYPGLALHPFPTCFVCGPERDEGDGLRIFPGPVTARQIVAAPWTQTVRWLARTAGSGRSLCGRPLTAQALSPTASLKSRWCSAVWRRGPCGRSSLERNALSSAGRRGSRVASTLRAPPCSESMESCERRLGPPGSG